jgi:hypothetical protein
MTGQPSGKRSGAFRGPLWVAALGVALGCTFSLNALRAFDWDPSVFLHVGRDDSVGLRYARQHLGTVKETTALGHDGKYFFIQAHDPLLLNGELHAQYLDLPAYRGQRMLYPLLAAPALLGGEWALAWALIVVNLAAIGLGTWATSRLAVLMGASPWWGLAFALNPGVIFEVFIDGSGALAWGLALVGLVALQKGRPRPASLALAVAALARETMLIVAVGAALWESYRRRPDWWLLVAVPGSAVGVWGLYVRWRLALPPWTYGGQGLGRPFGGLLQAAQRWPSEPSLHMVVGLVATVLVIATLLQAVLRPSLISYAVVGFALLAPFMTWQVWLYYFDITRAIAPLMTSFVLATVGRDVLASGSRISAVTADPSSP